MITRDRVLELLRYEAATGRLYWKVSRGGVTAGDMAGHLDDEGYCRLSIDDIDYLGHQIVFFIETGSFTPRLDHKDGCPSNNMFSNLRPCDQTLNNANQRKQSRPTSSRFKGVTKLKSGKWKAQIQVKYKNRHLGEFLTEVVAARAYDRAAVMYFGEFARLNFPKNKDALLALSAS